MSIAYLIIMILILLSLVFLNFVVLASIGCLLKKIDKQKALNNIKNKGVK